MSIEMSYKESLPKLIGRLVEEELRRDVRCPECGLEHAVFGLATGVDQHILDELVERRGLIELRQNDADGVERKVGEVEFVARNPFEEVSNFRGSRLLKQTFEPDIRIDEIHAQSPRHSSAFCCNCIDVY